MTNTEPTAVLVLYRLFVTSCVLTLGCSAAADTVECSACAPLDGQCPPGFVVSGDCNCVCGSEGNVLPIDRCDDLSCRAYLRSGYWAGYVRRIRCVFAYKIFLFAQWGIPSQLFCHD